MTCLCLFSVHRYKDLDNVHEYFDKLKSSILVTFEVRQNAMNANLAGIPICSSTPVLSAVSEYASYVRFEAVLVML